MGVEVACWAAAMVCVAEATACLAACFKNSKDKAQTFLFPVPGLPCPCCS